MDQIAQLGKESAHASQQSAKACQDLSDLALALQNMVGSFKLDAAPAEKMQGGRRRTGAGRTGGLC